MTGFVGSALTEVFEAGITWDDICRMKVPVPPLDEQIEIVQSYQAITDRIALKKQINDNLAA